jgi:hypothetical protein
MVLFLVGSLACGDHSRELPLDNKVINAGLDPENPSIVALVAYFENRGIQLAHERDGWWRVVQPANQKFDVIVSLRSFPQAASVEQVREALARINLAYHLNPGSHLAMSYPGVRGGGPEATKDAGFVRLKADLERLFREYRPG